MCRYFCIGFIYFMLKGKSLLDYTNLFFIMIMDYKIIFSITKKMKKLSCVICGKYRNVEKPKIPYLLEKTLVLSIICRNCKNEDKKLFKKEKQLRY